MGGVTRLVCYSTVTNCTVTLRRSGRSKTKLTIEDEADVDKLQNGRNATTPDGFPEQN